LQATPTSISGASFDITVQKNARTFLQSNDDLTLKAGWAIVIYVMNPDSVNLHDVGTPVIITVFTANAQYQKTANVEGAQ
jgi:hypothetical protein